MNQLQEIKERSQQGGAVGSYQQQDQRIDVFSAQGFALACRLANAFASSDAVPAAFRSMTLKGKGENAVWVENPAALGNCIVAIETAMSIGMAVTAVMQNADIIEGKLRWSDKFIIAAINASGRFTPLRFDIKNLGMITAKYQEKGAWDNANRRYAMTEKSVDVENLKCVAWALPSNMQIPPTINTLDAAVKAGLPVIVGPAVSIKLAVEEGWYSKAGSKWQTELREKMLTYRAGRFFGDIHAPDVVMGMGRTSDEERDMIDITPPPAAAPVTLDELKTPAAAEASPVADKKPEAVVAKVDVAEDKAPQAGAQQQTQEAAQPAAQPQQQPAETDEQADYRRSQEKLAAQASAAPAAEPVRRTRQRTTAGD